MTLLADSMADTLEKMFWEITKILPCWGFQIVPLKIQRGEYFNYLQYSVGLQNLDPKKYK